MDPAIWEFYILPLQIHHEDWPADFFYMTSCTPITGDYTDYKHGDYELHCPFHGAQYLMDLLHKHRQLSLEFIAQKTLISLV